MDPTKNHHKRAALTHPGSELNPKSELHPPLLTARLLVSGILTNERKQISPDSCPLASCEAAVLGLKGIYLKKIILLGNKDESWLYDNFFGLPYKTRTLFPPVCLLLEKQRYMKKVPGTE